MQDKTFYLYTLGCKANQYDSQVIREGLLKSGFSEAPADEAHFSIINSCTVTAQADNKARKQIRAIITRNPSSKILITGCGAKKHEDLFADSPQVVFIGGNEFKDRIVGIVNDYIENYHGMTFNFPDLNTISPDSHAVHITAFEGHTRVFVKVQDGCEAYCTYCTIPYERGDSRSREIDDVCKEVERLAKNGFHEIVLTGIHLAQYKTNQGKLLTDLMRALVQISDVKRLRLSSLEPHDFPDDFPQLFASSDIIQPHLHLPIQSGNNNILKKMNRRYTVERYREIVAEIRRLKPDFLLTTDFIVGFPTETEERFMNSLENVLDIGFSKVHIFPFSARRGTPAEKMHGKVSKEDIRRRVKYAIDETYKKAFEIKQSFIGRDFEVLVESTPEKETGNWSGFTPNYLKVQFASDANLANSFVPVQLKQVLYGDEPIMGELLHVSRI